AGSPRIAHPQSSGLITYIEIGIQIVPPIPEISISPGGQFPAQAPEETNALLASTAAKLIILIKLFISSTSPKGLSLLKYHQRGIHPYGGYTAPLPSLS
ncbi:hypothetical protein, partial [Pseudomonas viridiflava]|uniref:hypothetical protein n=1 Tax=Pseudomonas viridiflava TaxID=33069 RepID=UPI0019D1AC98